MAFEQYLNQVIDENKLFLFIANDVHSNFTTLLDKFFVIHLKDEGEKKASITKVAGFTDSKTCHDYFYGGEFNAQPCILIKPQEWNLRLLLSGKYYFSEIIVTKNAINRYYWREGTVLRAEQPAQAITTEASGVDELRSRFTDAGEQILKTRRNKAV